MTRHVVDLFEDDKAFGAFLRDHDLVTPPSTETLAVMESRIMEKIADQPGRLIPTGFNWLPAMSAQSWASRSAGVLGVLVLMLGFLIGRDFNTLSAENTNAPALYAATGGTPWQSFLMTASAGESDDVTDDTANDASDDTDE